VLCDKTVVYYQILNQSISYIWLCLLAVSSDSSSLGYQCLQAAAVALVTMVTQVLATALGGGAVLLEHAAATAAAPTAIAAAASIIQSLNACFAANSRLAGEFAWVSEATVLADVNER
jgi:hypothetical protein